MRLIITILSLLSISWIAAADPDGSITEAGKYVGTLTLQRDINLDLVDLRYPGYTQFSNSDIYVYETSPGVLTRLLTSNYVAKCRVELFKRDVGGQYWPVYLKGTKFFIVRSEFGKEGAGGSSFSGPSYGSSRMALLLKTNEKSDYFEGAIDCREEIFTDPSRMADWSVPRINRMLTGIAKIQ